ncbi:hypothetical protein ACJX0J_016017, partial [Zea mays]
FQCSYLVSIDYMSTCHLYSTSVPFVGYSVIILEAPLYYNLNPLQRDNSSIYLKAYQILFPSSSHGPQMQHYFIDVELSRNLQELHRQSSILIFTVVLIMACSILRYKFILDTTEQDIKIILIKCYTTSTLKYLAWSLMAFLLIQNTMFIKNGVLVHLIWSLDELEKEDFVIYLYLHPFLAIMHHPYYIENLQGEGIYVHNTKELVVVIPYYLYMLLNMSGLYGLHQDDMEILDEKVLMELVEHKLE